MFSSNIQFYKRIFFLDIVYLVKQMCAFQGKNMFQTPSFILMRLDSRIIQLDWCSELLLISTLSRCYVCDTVKERYRQIGHKLREGEYGACFYVTGDRRDLPSRYEHRGSKTGGAFSSLSADEKFACCEGLQNLKMFCARPGSRLWKVKTDGTVLSTHHFKQALAIPPTNITGPHDMQRVGGSVLEATQNEECGRQSFNFTKLFIIAKKFIFTFKRDGIYILDPDKGSVILWNNSFKDIVDAKTLDDAVYIWTASGRMHALLMLPLDRVLVRLYLRKEYALCAHLCGLHHKYLMELASASSKLQILADLGTKLKDSEVARTIHPLLQQIRKFAREKQNVQRLRSGIFLVENKQFFCSKEGENGESLKSHLCVRSTKEKSRSLSASPESSRRKKNGASRREMKSVSVTSLPELAFRSNGLSTEDGTQPYHRLRAKHDSSGDALVSKSGDSLSSSDSAFHPEGVQVLKELKYSVSWKSLKEKWKMLEGKMKLLNQDTVLEPFDIRPSDYQDAVLDEECSNEHMELVHSYGDKSRPRESHFPVLDVSNITDLCNLFVTCEQSGADKSELVCELLNAICTIYELFIRALLKTDFNIVDDGTVQISKLGRLSNLKSEFNVTGTFPFAYYFADDTVKIIRDEFHLALKTKSLITWLQNRVQDVRLQHTDRLPEHLKDFYSEDAVKLDIILSNIFVVFSELFDPSLMLQYVQTSELSCYYFSLCVILDRYEEGNLYCTGDGTSGQAAYDEMPPPLLLSTIFFMFGVERVETCCKLSKRVSVKDVWYLIMRLLQYAESNGNRESAKSHCYSLFLSYLEKMPASSDCLSKVFSDDHLRLYATVAFEEVNSVANGSCVCGFPVICSKTMLYPDLAKVLVSYYWDSNQGRLIELCKKVPSLWHLILPRKEDGGFSSVLPLIIHLGDTLELEKWLPTMDHDAWSRTLDLLAVFRSGTCVNCGSVFATSKDQLGGMLWSSVGPLMVKALGPHEAVQLMTKYASHIAPGELGVRLVTSF